jgi:putative polyketide hydroxylase
MGHFLNVMFRADYGPHLRERPAILYQTLSSDYFEFFVAINGENLWLMHHFLQPSEGPEDFPAERLQALIRDASGLPAVSVEILSVMPWVMSPKVARRYRSGRVFLVGDAAARLSPAGGLGLNTGLQGS